ncbi:MAG: phosphoglycerate mutase, partial [Thermodesulfobacteriota bacterium]
EAPDEAGHMGDLNLKVEAIEAFDQRVVGNLLRGIREFERFKILVLPDHPTPLSLRTHVDDPVPFLIYSSFEDQREAERKRHVKAFNEASAKESGIFIENGYELIEKFLGSNKPN